MKTDPFDDAIRRKLEGVEPPYQEKNWFQFQRFMSGQGFPPSLWQTPARWLQPALTAAAITGMIVTSVWQYQANKTLTANVQTLTKTVERLEQVQNRMQQSATARTSPPARVDTVYLTQANRQVLAQTYPPAGNNPLRDVPTTAANVPARSAAGRIGAANSPERGTAVPSAQRTQPTAGGERYAGGTPADQPTPSQPRPASPETRSAGETNAADVPASGLATNAPGRSAVAVEAPGRSAAAVEAPGRSAAAVEAPGVDAPTTNVFTGNVPSAGKSAGNVPGRSAAGRIDAVNSPTVTGNAAATERTRLESDGRSKSRNRRGRPTTSDYATDNQSIALSNKTKSPNDKTLYAPSVTNASSAIGTNVPSRGTAATNLPEAVATVQPVALILQPVQSDLAENWERRVRRIARRSPYSSAGSSVAVAPVTKAAPTTKSDRTPTQAPTSAPEKNTVPTALQGRLGVGGEVGTVQSGVGVYGELILNNWTLGLGATQTRWAGDSYQTEQQFKVKKGRDFQRDYGVQGPPRPPFPGRQPVVVNINRNAGGVVIPLHVGYRVGLGRQFVLTPQVGLNLSVNPTETIRYTHDLTYPENDWRMLIVRRSVWSYSNYTVGVGLERQFGRFAGQLTPIATLPLTVSNASLNDASVGLRGRLFYRF